MAKNKSEVRKRGNVEMNRSWKLEKRNFTKIFKSFFLVSVSQSISLILKILAGSHSEDRSVEKHFTMSVAKELKKFIVDAVMRNFPIKFD